MCNLRFLAALWVSKAAALAIRLISSGRGTNYPGVLALRIDPLFLKHFRGTDPEKTIFITGTNGKSTTTTLLTNILREAGLRVTANLGGANMTSGLATAMLHSSSLTGRLNCDYLVMETDERYVAGISKQLPAKYLCVTNIQRDQVQRNGEPGFILDRIRKSVNPDMTLILNRDEPNAYSLSRAGAARTVTCGVEPGQRSIGYSDRFFSVGMPCPVCHSGLRFSACNISRVGQYACPVCGFGEEAQPDYLAEKISFSRQCFSVQGVGYAFHYATPQFLYSYVMALTAARELGVEEAAIARAFDSFRTESNRLTAREIGGRTVQYYKMKQENSETVQGIVDVIAEDRRQKTVFFGIDEYIDFYPPYINTCFLFDCDFQPLRESGVSRVGCFAPYAASSTALRFAYDGFSKDAVVTAAGSSEKELEQELQETPEGPVYLVEEIPFWDRKGGN